MNSLSFNFHFQEMNILWTQDYCIDTYDVQYGFLVDVEITVIL